MTGLKKRPSSVGKNKHRCKDSEEDFPRHLVQKDNNESELVNADKFIFDQIFKRFLEKSYEILDCKVTFDIRIHARVFMQCAI